MPESKGEDGRWAAADAVAPNETYVGHRLRYQRFGEVERGLADVADNETARGVLRRAFGGAGRMALFFILLALFFSVAGIDAGDLLTVLWLFSTIGWLAISLLFPVSETLSEWHLLLDGKASLAESAYAVVWRSLKIDHNIPARPATPRIRVGPPLPGVRNFLVIQMGVYRIYVSIFGFGNDLYLGWSLRRRMNPVVVVLRWLRSHVAPDPGLSDLLDVEPVKAMRDAVHNALRQSIETAAADEQVDIKETFGYDVPITWQGPVGPAHGSVPQTWPHP